MTHERWEQARIAYRESMAAIRARFFGEPVYRGPEAIRDRSAAAETLAVAAWQQSFPGGAPVGLALLATGGFGRRELFPASDVDLLLLIDKADAEKPLKEPIRRFTQLLWDAGTRVAATTRSLAECTRFDPGNVEFTISLLDARSIAGDGRLAAKLLENDLPALQHAERRAIASGLLTLVRERHARYGGTIFHLEPDVKECPGALRDVNCCGWFERLDSGAASEASTEFSRATAFIASVRCFLHFCRGRDVNALDWKAQAEAASEGVGLDGAASRDPAYWMQMYFRHARAIGWRLDQHTDALPRAKPLLRVPEFLKKRSQASAAEGFHVQNGRIMLQAAAPHDAAEDFDTVLRTFAAVASTGLPMEKASEERVGIALAQLSAGLEEGEPLWEQLKAILTGRYAGLALRSMHAQGLLELLVPEFHAIDALVIRDAYHRYTVDEHTFVLIDTLHELEAGEHSGPLAEWARRLSTLMKDLQQPALLYLAALLHDTGKGRATGDHTRESRALAESVLQRLRLDSFESTLVLRLIERHLEMSAALRRDIFAAETVRAFAEKVPTPEELRQLTLFTYADINAVHPDALTPWKAENLWRLYIATSNYLDRNVDEERVDARVSSDVVQRIVAIENRDAAHADGQTTERGRALLRFLEGFPRRYLQTRSPEQIHAHFMMTESLGKDNVQVELAWRADRSELTLVARDRRLLFAAIAGVLAAWGMNIITADAFSNTQGVVVDTFRFTDGFRTLELNPGERERLRSAVHDAVRDDSGVAKAVENRKRARLRDPLVHIAASVKLDRESSTHSTLVQVVAQDQPGLLYALSRTLGEARCNIEVALIDTEGEMAIDVFYVTREGEPLRGEDLPPLEAALLASLRSDLPQAASAASP